MTALLDPAVSIIMPIYNADHTLEEALKSALGQSLKDIELICIDDGSTDVSLSILQRSQKTDSRIQVITQENAGAGPARNAGLSIARGTYIAFLDPDDLYPSETCLEELYRLAVSNKAKIAGGSLLFLDGDQISEAKTGDSDFTFSETRQVPYRDFQQAYYYQRFIYARDMLDKAGIRFPAYRRFQDVVFFVQAMHEAGEFLSTEMPTYMYRKSNKYATLSDTQINDMLRGYIDVLTLAKSNAYSDLFAFLSKRIGSKNAISEMVQSSVEEGNQTAQELYSQVLAICNSSFNESNLTEDQVAKEVRSNKGLRDIARSLLIRFKK